MSGRSVRSTSGFSECMLSHSSSGYSSCWYCRDGVHSLSHLVTFMTETCCMTLHWLLQPGARRNRNPPEHQGPLIQWRRTISQENRFLKYVHTGYRIHPQSYPGLACLLTGTKWQADETDLCLDPTWIISARFLNNIPTMTALFIYLDLPCPSSGASTCYHFDGCMVLFNAICVLTSRMFYCCDCPIVVFTIYLYLKLCQNS